MHPSSRIYAGRKLKQDKASRKRSYDSLIPTARGIGLYRSYNTAIPYIGPCAWAWVYKPIIKTPVEKIETTRWVASLFLALLPNSLAFYMQLKARVIFLFSLIGNMKEAKVLVSLLSHWCTLFVLYPSMGWVSFPRPPYLSLSVVPVFRPRYMWGEKNTGFFPKAVVELI